MSYLARDKDIIFALATPPGHGAIGVVRVSGEGCAEICRPLLGFLPKTPVSHKVYYGFFKDPKTAEKVDEVLVSYFSRGRSYTGEESLEISFHGSPTLIEAAMMKLGDVGCRPADRGEFTYRAYMNDRIDLLQAEAVQSLVQSRNSQVSHQALRQLEGQLSGTIQEIKLEIIRLLAHLEANIDFATEGLEAINFEALNAWINNIELKITRLVNSYSAGKVLRDGLRVAIIGCPNAGKSSLMNAILGKNRAIVSEHAGTTRDTLESSQYFGQILSTLVDTAGLRETDDSIEKEGVLRSVETIEASDLVLYVFDILKGWTDEDQTHYDKILKSRPVLVVGSKKDLLAAEVKVPALPKPHFLVSSLTGDGLIGLTQSIEQMFSDTLDGDGGFLISARQHRLLSHVQNCVVAAKGLILERFGEEIIAIELREALKNLNDLLGIDLSEDVISKIFSDFCIGK